MPRAPKALVLDSWAVLAYLGGEASSQKVADLIAGAHEDRTPMDLRSVNAGEVWYIIAREASEPEADRAVADLMRLPAPKDHQSPSPPTGLAYQKYARLLAIWWMRKVGSWSFRRNLLATGPGSMHVK